MNCKNIFVLLLFITVFISCKKQLEWLEVKANKADVVPSKLSDYQALLDNDDIYMNNNYPCLTQVSTDDLYATDAVWASADIRTRNAYAWVADLWAGTSGNDWNTPYTTISYANICLEGIEKIARDSSNALAWDNIRGSALFYRAYAYYMLSQEFSAPYDKAIADTALGIVLRNSSDVNIKAVRATMAESWRQINTDLQLAETLLPDFPSFATRPSKWAVRGLMARVSLAMNDYANAKNWADKALQQNNFLLDFNSLNSAATYPLPTYQTGNKEILFYATAGVTSVFHLSGFIDSVLYKSYATNDLRRTLYFKGSGNIVSFRGFYSGVVYSFGGIANNELYLIRAEANARLGNASAAMSDLNTLLAKRWKTGSFIPFTAADANDALLKVLTERRKELIYYCNTRWEDLRRLNREPAFAKTITRYLNGQSISLLPNDKRYTMPIPDIEIKISQLQQNPR